MNKSQLFDRTKMSFYPLAERENKVWVQEVIFTPSDRVELSKDLDSVLEKIAQQIMQAKKNGASVICAYGAHAIKNGLGLLLGKFLEQGWFTHVATNGAGIIHDWELAYQGMTSEDVRKNVQEGKFGTWAETGLVINLALAVGAYQGLGYGESMGACIAHNGLQIPTTEELHNFVNGHLVDNTYLDDPHNVQILAAALDLMELLSSLAIPAGFFPIEHPYRDYSAQYLAYTNKTRSTSHPMFGHDIIYTHSANRGSVIGRTAERDFLSFVESVSKLEGGVYVSVGSAVMSPMIFEKALSMARNVSLQQGNAIKNIQIHVVDLQKSTWDWSKGEPPVDNPAYYLRFMKTFNRMGCHSSYTSADNRDFLLGLYQKLVKLEQGET
jgi:hypothetical protein